MKAKFFSVMAIPALVMSSSSAFAAQGETSEVRFTGEIKENTCVLDTGSKNLPVELGVVESSVLSEQGKSSQPKPFTITLKDCDLSNASVTFSGETENETALKVNGGATGVGIQILENGNLLSVDGSKASAKKDTGSGTATFDFAARYIALKNGITGGTADAVAKYTVNYD